LTGQLKAPGGAFTLSNQPKILHLVKRCPPWEMKRTQFIRIAAAATAVLALPALYYYSRKNSCRTPLLRPAALACFCDEQTIRRIGEDYITAKPIISDPKKNLEEKILKGYNDPSSQEPDDTRISDWIEDKIRRDFIDGRVVIVDGWVLSETEACQCALLSLN
jgi:hypothetical protein